MFVIGCYLTYLTICLAVTVWVARTLHTNGRVFLVDAFHGNTELADSVNHLLVVGFDLINIGYVALALRATETLNTLRGAIELVLPPRSAWCCWFWDSCTSSICSCFPAFASARPGTNSGLAVSGTLPQASRS